MGICKDKFSIKNIDNRMQSEETQAKKKKTNNNKLVIIFKVRQPGSGFLNHTSDIFTCLRGAPCSSDELAKSWRGY